MTAQATQILAGIFKELAARCDEEGYTFANDHDLDRWATELGTTWLKALDIVGAELARKYDNGAVSYKFGDSLANDLEGILITRHQQVADGEWPPLFWEVYEAFDAGEFRWPEDGDADPVVLYTNPAISDIVAKLD
ncbi:hypothetical protein [Erythrobacter aureus]|uniref:hypothetical protein n=1 Tax=Erythrobacter aureus TaxID=2182384 RepID=UPI003A8E6BAD